MVQITLYIKNLITDEVTQIDHHCKTVVGKINNENETTNIDSIGLIDTYRGHNIVYDAT